MAQSVAVYCIEAPAPVPRIGTQIGDFGMPQRLLTDRFCSHAKVREAEVQTDYFDEQTPGLALRVSQAGRKSWTYLYTGTNGKRRRLTFGSYPATSLASVRAKVDLLKGEIEAGIDPQPLAPDTLQAVCEEYQSREGKHLRTAAKRERDLNRLVYPALGHRPIGEIKRSEIVRFLDGVEDNNGPVMADRTLGLIRKIMNWHASRSDEFRSPIVRGMARSKARSRDRILTDDELRKLWRAEGVFGSLVRFILLTAARRGEASEMVWAELSGRDWTLPASRNKTKLDLVRPLSKAALAALPKKVGGCAYVFSTNGRTPIDAFSRLTGRLSETTGVRDWSLHDLRRSARSLMSRAGIASDHAERCLGHVIGGVRGVYDRYEYLEEKRRAFEALAAQIDRIINPRDNVVGLGRG
jgi:integrase